MSTFSCFFPGSIISTLRGWHGSGHDTMLLGVLEHPEMPSVDHLITNQQGQ